MTTVAIRDGVMAADGLLNDNGWSATKRHQKLVILSEIGCAVAAAGCIQDVELWKDWLLEGSPEDRKPDLTNFSGFMLKADGEIVCYETKLAPFVIYEPFVAVGTGEKFAIGAMEMGADAIKAVEIAARRDVWTGGEIDHVTLKELQGLRR